MRNRHFAAIAVGCFVFVSAAVGSVARLAPAPPAWPGSLGNGVTLLPNGWKIQPAGRHMAIGDLPLAMVESPDGNYLVVTNNGYAKPTLTIVDLKRGYVASKTNMDHAWLGLAWHPDGRRVYSSGAGQTTVNEFYWTPGRLTAGAVYALGRDTQKPMPGINRPEPVEQSFVGGIAISPDGRHVYAVHVLGEALTMLDLKSGLVRGTVDVGAEPYTCLDVPGRQDGVRVGLGRREDPGVRRGDAREARRDRRRRTPERHGPVEGRRAAVRRLREHEQRLGGRCRVEDGEGADLGGALPERAARSDAERPRPLARRPHAARRQRRQQRRRRREREPTRRAARSTGFIPTGWYPTAAQFSRDGSRIFVLSGKGLTSQNNPRVTQPGIPGMAEQYQRRASPGLALGRPDAGRGRRSR